MIIALLLVFVCIVVFYIAAYIIGIEFNIIRWLFGILTAPIRLLGRGLKKIFHI